MEANPIYHEFIRKCFNTVESLSNKLHEFYIIRNNFAKVCYDNINILTANGIYKEDIDNFILGKKSKGYIKSITCSNKILGDVIRINYNKLVNVSRYRIPEILNNIRFYDFLARCPESVFNLILKEINKNMVNDIIRGNRISLGTYLGDIVIVKAIKHMRIDFKKSQEKRKALIAEGIPVKSIVNPKGANWFVMATSPTYWFVRWFRYNKSVTILPQQIFYRFRKADRNKSLLMTESKYKTVEEVIEAPDISFGDKLNYMTNNDPDINNRYQDLILKKDRLKNNIKDEYIRPFSNI